MFQPRTDSDPPIAADCVEYGWTRPSSPEHADD
jgi:hypothetical protein